MKIGWYPGHMKRARDRINGLVKSVDLVVEIVDARLPRSSANPVLGELRGRKPVLRVLNKEDLADPDTTRAWTTHFEKEEGIRAIALSAKERSASARLQKLCRRIVPSRGTPGSPLRLMIVGIPNAGKSTLINTLAGRKIARVGDKPAITTCQQRIDLRNGILLFDTPGLLWPNIEDQDAARRLAFSGAIGEAAYDQHVIAQLALEWMVRTHPERLTARYKLTDLSGDSQTLLATIGSKRGCLVAGGEVDLPRAVNLFLQELRGGKLGRISFEAPE